MTYWWQERMTALDVETTGVDPEDDRIVSATVAHVGGGEPTEIQNWLVDPGVEIPAEAAEIHGITTERARVEGMPADEAIDEIFTSVAVAVGEGRALVIFNAPYDLTILDRELRRHRLGELWLPQECVIDPRILDGHLHRYREGSRKLAVTCEHYGARLDGAHNSSSDALAAARLAWVMGSRGLVIRRKPQSSQEAEETRLLREEWERVRNDLSALHRAQITWALADQQRLEKYLHEGNPAKGVPAQPDRVVPRGWPVLPFLGKQMQLAA